jgi:hypothetical protein
VFVFINHGLGVVACEFVVLFIGSFFLLFVFMGIFVHAFCVNFNWNPCLCESTCVCMNLFTCIQV